MRETDELLSRLQGVSEICLDPVMMTRMQQKPDLTVTTALIWALRQKSPNVLMCQSASYTVFHVYLWSLSSSRLTDAMVSAVCVCLQVTLLTESSRRLTLFPQVDYTLLMGTVSQLHDNFLSRPLCQSILKHLRSMSWWISHWNLHKPKPDIVPIISYWTKTPQRLNVELTVTQTMQVAGGGKSQASQHTDLLFINISKKHHSNWSEFLRWLHYNGNG